MILVDGVVAADEQRRMKMNATSLSTPSFEAPVTPSLLSSASEIAAAINDNVESWHSGAKSPEAFRADNLSLWRRAYDLNLDAQVSECIRGGVESLIFG